MIKIKTEILKTMLNKAIKVCSFNKMLPLTELIEISIENNILGIRTTDNVTNLLLEKPLENDNNDMRVVVDALLFTSLINKITTEYIEIQSRENSLTIIGNGVYEMEIRVDENNEIVKFPEINISKEDGKEFDFKQLVNKINICKAAIPDNLDTIELNNYYLKDNIIATNAFKVTIIPNLDELKTEEMLISKDLGKLLIELNLENAKYKLENNILTILQEGFILTSVVNQNLDKYPIDAINHMLKESFNYSVLLDKGEILKILDRLNLFVHDYENNSINLIFTKDKLNISNVKKTSSEDIDYIKVIDEDTINEFKCAINIVNLKQQLEALPSNEIITHFGGSDRAIKISDGDITEIISLMRDEE